MHQLLPYVFVQARPFVLSCVNALQCNVMVLDHLEWVTSCKCIPQIRLSSNAHTPESVKLMILSNPIIMNLCIYQIEMQCHLRICRDLERFDDELMHLAQICKLPSTGIIQKRQFSMRTSLSCSTNNFTVDPIHAIKRLLSMTQMRIASYLPLQTLCIPTWLARIVVISVDEESRIVANLAT